MIDEPTTAMATNPLSGMESGRLAEARGRAAQRVRHQREILQPLGWAVILVVAIGAAGATPHPGLHATGLWVTLALGAFAVATAIAIRAWFPTRGHAFQALVIAAMGGAGVVLAWLQSQGTSELAAGAAVWMALARLPLPLGVGLGIVTGAALDAVIALSGASTEAILAATLTVALLGLVAYFINQSRAGQERTELLLAQLEDAREEQTRAAAIAERSRIASELHDVLAHSLSGAAIQLQAARKLAEHGDAAPPVRAAIDRAGQLVKDGLEDARQAVGALRGEELPGVAQLDTLVTSFRNDMHLEVSLSVDGSMRSLSAEASLALYRGAQEALTNIARYAPGATVSVLLRYGTTVTTLSVDDRIAPGATPRAGDGLQGVGGGRGLAGLRERVERVGGTLQAGPTEHGWRVEVGVPA
jgi:signal transduction histidine kinase